MKEKLPDVQNTKVSSISIDRVGVTSISFPLTIKTKEGKLVEVYSQVNVYGSLPRTKKGTNMSRYLEVLNTYKGIPLNVRANFRALLVQLLKVVNTKDVYCEISFKIFKLKKAPVSEREGYLAYNCVVSGRLQKGNYLFFSYINKVRVPVTTVCPCSKDISKYGAHNQRGYIDVMILFEKNKSWPLEDIIDMIEQQGSCEIYSVLKRPDEKWVTEKSYQNAKFVEDICRDVSTNLQEIKVIRKFRVKVENFESIHDHNAVAYIFRKRHGNRWTIDATNVL